MIVFRIRHVPTGLYYCPVRVVRVKHPNSERSDYVKSNLSKRGKIYVTRPSLTHIERICDHTRLTWEQRLPFGMIARPACGEWSPGDLVIEEV